MIFMRRRWFSDCRPSRRDVLAWFTLVTDVDVLESSFFWFCVNWNRLFCVAASGFVLNVMSCKAEAGLNLEKTLGLSSHTYCLPPRKSRSKWLGEGHRLGGGVRSLGSAGFATYLGVISALAQHQHPSWP